LPQIKGGKVTIKLWYVGDVVNGTYPDKRYGGTETITALANTLGISENPTVKMTGYNPFIATMQMKEDVTFTNGRATVSATQADNLW
jgi:hypothetical protein